MTTWVCNQCKVSLSSAQSSDFVKKKGSSVSNAEDSTEIEFCNDDDLIEICSFQVDRDCR